MRKIIVIVLIFTAFFAITGILMATETNEGGILLEKDGFDIYSGFSETPSWMTNFSLDPNEWENNGSWTAVKVGYSQEFGGLGGAIEGRIWFVGASLGLGVMWSPISWEAISNMAVTFKIWPTLKGPSGWWIGLGYGQTAVAERWRSYSDDYVQESIMGFFALLGATYVGPKGFLVDACIGTARVKSDLMDWDEWVLTGGVSIGLAWN